MQEPVPSARCSVLLHSGDEDWLAQWHQRLEAAEAGSQSSHPYTLNFESHPVAAELCDQVRDASLVQCVVVDAQSVPELAGLIDTLHKLRSELDLFIATGPETPTLTRNVMLIDRDETRGEVLYRRIHRALEHRVSTPFAATLREYVEGARDAWHTPGHSSGDGLRDSPWVSDFYRLMGAHVFNADLSVSV